MPVERRHFFMRFVRVWFTYRLRTLNATAREKKLGAVSHQRRVPYALEGSAQQRGAQLGRHPSREVVHYIRTRQYSLVRRPHSGGVP